MGELLAPAILLTVLMSSRAKLWMCSMVLGCGAPRSSAPPPQPAARSTLVRGEEGVNRLMAEVCGQPCDTALAGSASTARTSAGGVLHMDLDAASCRVPGHFEEPTACSAVCTTQAQTVATVLVDMGPIGPNTRRALCMALERDRGGPTRGSCDDVCESTMGCAWPVSEARVAVDFIGHLEFHCSGGSPDALEPNQSAGSNSISP
ncbi:MAG: hypothetical protein KUG77_15215 [Nannocystaceae bacterium]|nr:hypothetical protein [Nannocystaceae bacterium]